MPNIINDDGFTRVRYQDLRIEKAQEYKDGFSNQFLKTDVQSGVGQEVSISTFAEDDLASRFQTMLSAFDPTAAQGVSLSRLSIIMNKRRQDATNSTVTIEITATAAGGTIPLNYGFEISNIAGDVVFRSMEEVIIAPSGSALVLFTAIDQGAVSALSGSLTVIKTPVFGIASVTNTDDASLGRDRETDTELRARCLNSSSGESSTVIGIASALSDVDGVTALKVIQNPTGAAVDGVPPYSVFPIVENGSDNDIAESLIKTVAAGIGYTEPADIPSANIVSGTYDDPITMQTYTAYWARPIDIRIYAEVTLTRLSNYPSDGDARVKQNIEDWIIANQDFGEDLYASQLYSPVQDVEGAIVIDIKIGLTAVPTDSVIPIDSFEQASVLISDITTP